MSRRLKWTLVAGAVAVAGSTTTTTTTTTTTAPTTTTTSATTTTTSPTTTADPSALPTGYTTRSARDFGVVCDGVVDDTKAIQAALDGINSYQALQLPAGTCRTTS